MFFYCSPNSRHWLWPGRPPGLTVTTRCDRRRSDQDWQSVGLHQTHSPPLQSSLPHTLKTNYHNISSLSHNYILLHIRLTNWHKNATFLTSFSWAFWHMLPLLQLLRQQLTSRPFVSFSKTNNSSAVLYSYLDHRYKIPFIILLGMYVCISSIKAAKIVLRDYRY